MNNSFKISNLFTTLLLEFDFVNLIDKSGRHFKISRNAEKR